MYRIQRFITRRNVLIILITLVVAIVAWLIGFHGFIQIEGGLSGKQTKYSQFNNSLQKSNSGKIGQNGLLTSGDYVFQAPMKTGGLYSVSVTIPHFFGTKTIEAPDFESSTTSIGRRVARGLAIGDSSIVSWNSKAAFKLESQNIDSNIDSQASLNLNGFRSITSYRNLTQLSASKLAGLRQDSGNSFTPVVYDFKTDQLLSYPSLSGGDVFLQKESGGFSIYNKSNSTVSYYAEGSSDVQQKKVGEAKRVLLYDGKPVYSYLGGSVNRLVVATGPAVFSGGDLPEDFKDNGESSVSLSVFDTKSDKRISQFALDQAHLIKLTLSVDGKYLVATTSESTTVYNIFTSSKIMTIPYTSSKGIFWLEGGDFILNADEYGILRVSPSKLSTHSLVPYSLIRPTQLSFIEDGQLYFTGFSSLNDFNKNPDAYRLSISKNADAAQRKSFRAFPHQGNGYYVDYVDSVVTIQLPRYISSRGVSVSSSAKEDALDYVNNMFNGTKPTIKFTYITTDLRTRDTSEE